MTTTTRDRRRRWNVTGYVSADNCSLDVTIDIDAEWLAAQPDVPAAAVTREALRLMTTGPGEPCNHALIVAVHGDRVNWEEVEIIDLDQAQEATTRKAGRPLPGVWELTLGPNDVVVHPNGTGYDWQLNYLNQTVWTGSASSRFEAIDAAMLALRREPGMADVADLVMFAMGLGRHVDEALSRVI